MLDIFINNINYREKNGEPVFPQIPLNDTVDEETRNSELDQQNSNALTDVNGTSPINAFSSLPSSIPILKQPPILQMNGLKSANDFTSDPSKAARKTKRLSRIYVDNSFEDQLDQLEVDQSLLDYLVRHGALTTFASEQIVHSEPYSRRVLLLQALGLPIPTEKVLSFIESHSAEKTHFLINFSLLLNGLRHTGHHSLASNLDLGRRITPSQCPISETDEIPSPNRRRRGQLSLWIRLDAIKLDVDLYQRLSALLSERKNQISSVDTLDGGKHCHDYGEKWTTARVSPTVLLPSFVENLHASSPLCLNVNSNTIERNSNQSVWLDHHPLSIEQQTERAVLVSDAPDSISSETKKKSIKKPVGCFSKIFESLRCRRKRKTTNRVSDSLSMMTAPVFEKPHHQRTVQSPGVNVGKTPVIEDDDTAPILDKVDQSSMKLNVLNSKSHEFYTLLLDSSLSLNDQLVKYFEQSSGLLVLGFRLDKPPAPLSTLTENATTTVFSNEALCITLVATQADLINKLLNACQPTDENTSNSKLTHNLCTILKKEGALQQLGLQDLRLSACLDTNEIELALEELADMVD